MMEIKNIKLISSNRGWGSTSDYYTEVEQRLTINFSGRIWLSYYIQGDRWDKYTLRQKEQFTINESNAAEILNLVSQHFFNDYDEVDVTDVGRWNLVIIKSDNSKHEFSGSMIGIVDKEGIDLTRIIRKILGLDNLVIFGDRYY